MRHLAAMSGAPSSFRTMVAEILSGAAAGTVIVTPAASETAFSFAPVASSVAAIHAGAVHVQGTINGYGERCGNADLVSIIPDLQLKMGHAVVAPDKLTRLAELSRYVSELANLSPDTRQPFVGGSMADEHLVASRR